MESPLTHRVDGPPDGPVAVLLNGGMMTLAAWEPFAGALTAAGRRVVRCDFRGQLRSPGIPSRTFEGHAADIVALLDRLGVERADVVGTSFGGQVGLVLAADRPERVRTLSAITVTDRTTPSILEGSRRTREACRVALAGGDRGALHDLLVEEIYAPGWREAHGHELDARRERAADLPDAWFRGVIALLDCLDDFDLGPRLSSIRCPVWIAAAGLDRIMGPEAGERLARRIPGARLERFEDAGHALIVEQTERVIERCLAFLAVAASDAGETR